MRHVAYASEFNTDIRLAMVLDKPAADALFRLAAVISSPPPLCLENLAASLCDYSEAQFLQASSRSLGFLMVSDLFLRCPFVCYPAPGFPRPFLPVSFRISVFNYLRDISHPGMKVTRRQIAEKYA